MVVAGAVVCDGTSGVMVMLTAGGAEEMVAETGSVVCDASSLGTSDSAADVGTVNVSMSDSATNVAFMIEISGLAADVMSFVSDALLQAAVRTDTTHKTARTDILPENFIAFRLRIRDMFFLFAL